MLLLGDLLNLTKSSTSMLLLVSGRALGAADHKLTGTYHTGNGGTANGSKVTNVQIGVSDFDKLAEFAVQNKVKLPLPSTG